VKLSRLILLALPLTAGTIVFAADPKVTALESRLAEKDQALTRLRTELDQARTQTDLRIESARSGLETVNHALETRVDQARADAAAERVRSGDLRDQVAHQQALLAGLQTQLDVSVRDRVSLTAALGKLTVAQTTAQKVAVSLARTHSGELADTSAELQAVHSDTKADIRNLAEKTDTQTSATLAQTMEIQRGVDQQRFLMWSTLGTAFFGAMIGIATLVAKDRIDSRHIKEIGFMRADTKAVSSHVLQLDNSLGELFPEIKATAETRNVVPHVSVEHPEQPKTFGSRGAV
jgi:hypothetical protein